MRIELGYPDHDAEVRVVQGDTARVSPDQLRPVLDVAALQLVIDSVRTAYVDPRLSAYAVRLAAATRQHPAVRYGASPRGSIALIRAAQALAATHGRAFVTPDDVKTVSGRCSPTG
jgi:MoxR-like ATPase